MFWKCRLQVTIWEHTFEIEESNETVVQLQKNCSKIGRGGQRSYFRRIFLQDRLSIAMKYG